MLINKNNIYLFLLLVFLGCGGVVGNIERYKFDISKNLLDSRVVELFIKFPELNIPDSSIYKEDSIIKLCMIHDGNRKIVFGFCLLKYNDNGIEKNDASEIVLTHAGVYGDILKFDSDLSYFEKYSYKKLFRSQFIEKIDQPYILSHISGGFNTNIYPPS